MIEVKDLVKYYGPVPAVKGISFTAEKRHIYGFLGPNGAGKSTTMNMITGCLAPTAGSVTVNGYDIYTDAKEAKMSIGYLPEIPPLYSDMTPLEYLEFIGAVKGLKGEELYDSIEDVLDKTGTSDVADRMIRNLSKGYKQRVGIAGALIGDPEIIILDEPTVGLDPIQIVEIRELIKSLKDEHTVILSSHILQEISAVCDHVIMISRGCIVADDTMENLLKDTSDEIAVRLETDASDKEKLEEVLSGVSGITSYEIIITNTGHCNIVIKTDKKSGSADRVFTAVRQAGYNVFSMTTNENSLEEVFIRLAGESLDAGAAYAKGKADKKAEKEARKGKIKVIGESPLGKAYYTEEFVDPETDDETDDTDEKEDDE